MFRRNREELNLRTVPVFVKPPRRKKSAIKQREGVPETEYIKNLKKQVKRFDQERKGKKPPTNLMREIITYLEVNGGATKRRLAKDLSIDLQLLNTIVEQMLKRGRLETWRNSQNGKRSVLYVGVKL
jgi:DNA-binding MarR family transcriptional regulator